MYEGLGQREMHQFFEVSLSEVEYLQKVYCSHQIHLYTLASLCHRHPMIISYYLNANCSYDYYSTGQTPSSPCENPQLPIQ
ncbi:hypothetical protein FGO68_gene15779 [Halteria grandinella]|uniref:Uncharacterized protein n=1 Tax=Halteria grandinella TaxID=5974 RepID=A0A8J8NYL6_HALGN|nr:hypothetical protein FGO68_gene15779 [Halteria grandinella]